ncbi:MAG: pyridoxamine 5'-phosphate oxidase family protein [Eubacteriales bacterium]|nr:pyridoxamine 5'-phosphate oxidase family protein [Eubacteriales bacterium]
MRLAKREVKDEEELRGILEDCLVMRLGLSDEEGMFVVPVNFGWEMEDREGEKPLLRLYFHGAKEGRKARAMRARPEAAFEMDCGHGLIKGDYSCAYSFSYRSIMGTGRLRFLEGEEEKKRGLTFLMEHMDVKAEVRFSSQALERTEVFCLESQDYTGKKR